MRCSIKKTGSNQGNHSHKVRHQAFRVLLIQTGFCILLSICLFLDSPVAAGSAMLGGVLYLLPMFYFTHRMFLLYKEQTAKQALVQIYANQIWKMLISAIAFAMVFILVKQVNPFALFGMFILMQISGWFAQIKLNNRFLKP